MEHVLANVVFPQLVADTGLNTAKSVMLLSRKFYRLTQETCFWLPYLLAREEYFIRQRQALAGRPMIGHLFRNSYVLIPQELLKKGGILAVIQSKLLISDQQHQWKRRNKNCKEITRQIYGTCNFHNQIVEGLIEVHPADHPWHRSPSIVRSTPYVSYREQPHTTGLVAEFGEIGVSINFTSGLRYDGPVKIWRKNRRAALGARLICTGGEVLTVIGVRFPFVVEWEGKQFVLKTSLLHDLLQPNKRQPVEASLVDGIHLASRSYSRAPVVGEIREGQLIFF
jgi:hypothetical protein